MMRLWLIRHGECELTAPSDEARLLTESGAALVQKMATRIEMEGGEGPTRILSSPFRRALQTAEFFAKAWKTEVEAVDWLLPLVEPSQVLARLSERPETSLALTGHLPNLGLLLSVLLWGLPPREASIARGAVLQLEAESLSPGAAKLKWVLNPGVVS